MEKLALAIRIAAKYREESYDHDASRKTVEKGVSLINFNNFYKISLRDAADKAADEVGFDKTGTEPIYLLLKYTWNDILDWANKISKEKLE